MKRTSLLDAAPPYTTLESYSITRRHIFHQPFRDFSLKLQQLQRELLELSAEDDWKWILSKFRRYRFDLAAAPVAFNNPITQPATLEQFQEKLERCSQLYPEHTSTSQTLFQLYSALRSSSDNPLRDWLAKELQEGTETDIGIVLLEPRLIKAAEEALSTIPAHNRIAILTPPQLRGMRCYRRLIVIGTAQWYARDNKEYIFRSPRSKSIDLLHYQWYRDTWMLEGALVGSGFTSPQIPTVEPVMQVGVIAAAGDTIVSADAIPVIDWTQYSTPTEKAGKGDPSQEIVEARLFLLEGGFAVYLDASEHAKSLIIDLSTEQDASAVRKLPAAEISNGLFILIRTEGGGDLVVPVADKVMGSRCDELRSKQADWKSRLKAATEKKTYLEVSCELLSLGATLADESNLRNWISARNIRTAEKSDFMAIMNYIGFPPNKGELYWDAMRAIFRAHLRAGTIISKRLKREVAESDLTDLVREGIKAFELEDEGGGSITAYRVTGKAPETTIVPLTQILRPFKAEKD